MAEDDPRLATETAGCEIGGTKVSGYLARLKGGSKRPAVVAAPAGLDERINAGMAEYEAAELAWGRTASDQVRSVRRSGSATVR